MTLKGLLSIIKKLFSRKNGLLRQINNFFIWTGNMEGWMTSLKDCFVKKYYLFGTHNVYMRFHFIQKVEINHNPSLLLSTNWDTACWRVMVYSDGFLNHHSEFLTFFSAKISCIFLKNRLFTKFWWLQNLLRSLRILLRSLQNLPSSTTLDDEKRVKKQEIVMVFLNHHYKPSLLKLL